MENVKKKYGNITPVLMGNFLEILEFSLYGIFAKTFSDIFFEGVANGFLYSLIIFSSGFLARPLGGILFGYIGDVYGRRKALILSILLMSLSTLAIGLLPLPETIGIASPLCLLVLRIMQGVSCGGEYIGITIYLIERYPGRLGTASAYAATSGMSGTLVAILISYIAQKEAGLDLKWRLPFLISGCIGFIILYYRMNFQESPVFQQIKKEGSIPRHPLKIVLKKYSCSFFSTCLLGGFNGILTFTLIVYFNIFLMKIRSFALEDALKVNFVSVCCFIMMGLLLGIAKDFVGIKARNLAIGISILALSLSHFIFAALTHGTLAYVFLAQILFAAIAGAFSVTCNMLMFHLFPQNIRYSGMAFGYSIGISIFGGNALLVYEFISKMAPPSELLFLYVVLGALLALAAVFVKPSNFSRDSNF